MMHLQFWAEYGKGSANVLLEWQPTLIGRSGPRVEPWRIAISSCHLDSKSATKRATQIQAAENAPTTLATDGRWDVQFTMGDLSFRVNNTRPYTLNEFCTTLLNNRAELFGNDSLRQDQRLQTWEFPDPCAGAPGSAMQWPTYKKFYKGSKGATARGVHTPTLESIPKVWDVKLDKQGLVKEGGRAGQYDFGWLDRIGYRTNPAAGRTVRHLYSDSLWNQILSDHAPVYSIFEVN